MLVQSSLGKLVQHHGYFNGQYIRYCVKTRKSNHEVHRKFFLTLTVTFILEL